MSRCETMGVKEESFKNSNSGEEHFEKVECDSSNETIIEFHDLTAEHDPTMGDGQKDGHPHKESKQKQNYDCFLTEIEQLPTHEAKLEKAILFMETSISSDGAPQFKNFWDARALSLGLFKQNIAPALRSNLWAKYTELSKEARRLKEVLEEQSAFAAEQIEIAIQALEKEIQNNSHVLETQPPLEFPIFCQSLEKNIDFYSVIQKELNHLNVQAARVNALRKELIRTEMRIRVKNKFFQRLSAAGDQVFPRRKDLIKELSHHFSEDIDAFIKENFSNKNEMEPLFSLREEIKALQGIAKLLTLNTQSFTHARYRLSECWDHIKKAEKEWKKAKAQKKVSFKQNQELVQQKIQELTSLFEATPHSTNEALKKIDEVVVFMRKIELGRDEVKALREEVSKLRQPILDKQAKEETDRIQHEQDRERNRKEHLEELRRECEQLINKAETEDAESLATMRAALTDKINQGTLSKGEKQDLERLLKPLRDIIADKKAQALLDLSEDDREKLEHLSALLKEKKERQQEVKKQVKLLQKAKSSSGLGIMQAFDYDDQINLEEKRLEEIDQSIHKLEAMIEEIEERS